VIVAVRFYDEALLNKFKKWTAGTEMTIYGVNDTRKLFEVLADKSNDSPLKLPIIAISRGAGFTINQKNKEYASYNGLPMINTGAGAARLNAIPITIDYQLDVYTRYLEEADEYARNIVFNIVNYPKLTIEIPYEGSKLVHDANIRLQSEVEDNSDIPERLVSGQFVRLTMGLNIDDAYLFDVRLKDNISIVEVCTREDDLPRELGFDDFYKKN
jgi:hypothetical protein